jgi:hypothetical protein
VTDDALPDTATEEALLDDQPGDGDAVPSAGPEQ